MPAGIGYGDKPGVMASNQGNQTGGRARRRSPMQPASPMTPPPAAPGPFQPMAQMPMDMMARPVPRSPMPMSGMKNGPGLEQVLMMMLTGGLSA